MSFGLGHGRPLDPAPGVVGVAPEELPPLPDDLINNPESGRVDPRAWFDHPEHPFELEIGSGKGTFLVQQGDLQPETNFLGVEWAGEFYAYAADRVRRRRESGGLLNVRLLHGDATGFLRWRCPPSICRVIHLYFSDPWPKTRHHKNRVVQHRFLADAWRALVAGGELRIVTDHDELWAWNLAHFEHWAADAALPEHRDFRNSVPADTLARFRAALPEMPETVARLRAAMPGPPFEMLPFDRPGSAGEGELVGTNFERKFRIAERSFHACVLRKRPARDA
jgi:tRNA (guanine-N7-)-methyltransferase